MRIPFFGHIDKPGDARDTTLDNLVTLYDTANKWRQLQEPEWEQNALFLVGNQWDRVEYDSGLRATRRITPPRDKDKFYAVNNFSYALLRQAMTAFRGKLGQQIAIPASTEIEDEIAAEISTDFLTALHDSRDEEEQRFHEIMLAAICGRCLRHTYWDGDATGKTIAGEIEGLGDIASETISPMRYHLEPWAETFEGCKWVILSDVRDIEEVKALFPGKAKNIEPEDYDDTSHKLDRLLGNLSGAGVQNVPDRKDALVLRRLFFRPTQRWPQGRLFWFSGKVFFEVSDLPDGIFPFDAIDWFPIPLRQAPLPFMTVIRGPQTIYNTMLSQAVDLANRQLRCDVVTSGQGKITQEKDPKTGQKRIFVPPGGDFKLMEYNLNATQTNLLMERAWENAQHLAGVRQSSMGDVPPGVKSGIAIKMLQNQDDLGLSLFKSGFQATYEKIAEKELPLAKAHYDIPRVARVVGEGKLRKVQMFFGAELRNTTDVRTRTIPLLSEAEQMQIRQDAWAAGLFGPWESIGHKVACMRALLASGLPNIEEEVEKMCAPSSYEELERMAGELDLMNGEVQAAVLQSQMAMAQQVQAGPEGAPTQQPVGTAA